jgi:hypothetical protein
MIKIYLSFLLCIHVQLCWNILSSHAFVFGKSSRTTSRSTFSNFIIPSEQISETQIKLFSGLFGKKEQENRDPSNPTRVFDIPCSSIKLGGCRFALGLFLIGQQGTPLKGTWKANQASDGVLDMFHSDNTGMFSVVLTEKSVSVDRYGLAPSLQYRLQESLILHRLLDEIKSLALEGENIKEENRLIVLKDPDVIIQQAREKLPARASF